MQAKPDEGKLLWSFQANQEINSRAKFYKDKVLFGSQDATLYCLDAIRKTGRNVQTNDQIRCSPRLLTAGPLSRAAIHCYT